MDDERPAKFEAVYRETYGQITAYAVRRYDSPKDAADVVAETFAIAWRRMDDLPSGKRPLWLYGVARNVLADHHRSGACRGCGRYGGIPWPGRPHCSALSCGHTRRHLPLGPPRSCRPQPATAEAAPEGAYWHLKALYAGSRPGPYGKDGDTYYLETSSFSEKWVAKNGRTWIGRRQLAVPPWTWMPGAGTVRRLNGR